MIVVFIALYQCVAIVQTQYWDRDSFKEVYSRAFSVHELVNRPDNVKRFIIGRQFCTVLVVFLLAQVSTFPTWNMDGLGPVPNFIIIRSGLVGVLIVLSFGQLLPELLAAEFPLRFMNMRGSFLVVWTSLIMDELAVGHAAWTVYFTFRSLLCGTALPVEDLTQPASPSDKPAIVRVKSAELLEATGSPYGHDSSRPSSLIVNL